MPKFDPSVDSFATMRARAPYLKFVLAGVFGGLAIVALPYIVISEALLGVGHAVAGRNRGPTSSFLI